MIAKISLTAAFFLMMAPPIACASIRAVANPSLMTRQAQGSPPRVIVAQEDQPNVGTSDNDSDDDNASDSDNDSSGSDDDNQNANSSQANPNTPGDAQPVPPTVLGGPDNDPGEAQQAPQMNSDPQPQPVNPYQ